MRLLKRIIFGIFLLLLIWACSNTKNTFVTRSYHNVTSHFNVYFNGYESFKEGVMSIENNHQDDFTRIIPVYIVSTESTVGSAVSQMDRALEKGTKVLELHSIKAKPKMDKGSLTPKQRKFLRKKEYNKWVDDSYMLIGKSHFYKRDYNLAIETFRFVEREFEKEPIKLDAWLWLARAYIETNEFEDALKMLGLLEEEKKIEDWFQSEIDATYAQLYIKQENLNGAIKRLQSSLKETKGKENKVRRRFVLAQMYQRNGANSRAYILFKKVVKMNPSYVMAFNSKLNMAKSYQKGQKGASIKDELMKMAKDEKNKEFLDQIYYALAEIYLKENNFEKGISFLRKSAAVSTGNDIQKAVSYITIADLYYEHTDYIQSQYYYDSAVGFIDEGFPDYETVQSKATSLKALVQDVNNVALQDSVQKIALLSKGEQLQLIDGIIAKKAQAERKKKEAEAQRRKALNEARSASRGGFNNAAGSNWYFYNNQAKEFGKREFGLKWGNRKLEDHWRRKNKKVVDFGDLLAEDETEDDGPKYDEDSREYYLQDIPNTDSAMLASHESIKTSLINIGLLYKNQLQDLDKAADAFNSLITRYPESRDRLMSYYNLYLIHFKKGEQNFTELYKNKIINEFPDSDFAKILLNPEYFAELDKKEKQVQILYEQVYGYYTKGMYNHVIQNVNRALKEYPNDPLIPKFAYLKALSSGKMEGEESLREQMLKFIEEYPLSETIIEANTIIKYIDEKYPQFKQREEQRIAMKLYKANPSAPHVLLILFKDEEDLNQLAFNLLSFNLDNFESLDLKVEKQKFQDYDLVTIQEFKDLSMARSYIERYNDSSNVVYKDTEIDDVEIFHISQENLTTLNADNILSRYKYFYRRKY